jgi:hypothetical protein
LTGHKEVRHWGGEDGWSQRKIAVAWPYSGDAGGEEGADMWGPNVSYRGERRRHSRKAQTEGESAFVSMHHGTRGPARPAGEAVA